MSTKKTSQRFKHKIDAASHGLGKFARRSKLLPKPNADQRMQQGVPAAFPMAFHDCTSSKTLLPLRMFSASQHGLRLR